MNDGASVVSEVAADDYVSVDSDALRRRRWPEPPKAQLSTSRVRLESVGPGALEFLRVMETSESLIFRWRLRGGTPGPDEYVTGLSAGVYAQFLVFSEPGQDVPPLGLLTAHNEDPARQFVYVAGVKFDLSDVRPHFLEGAMLFVNYLFAARPYRKLYMDVPEYNMGQIASSVGRLFEVEGHLREHSSSGNRTWDHYVLAMHRDRWETYGARYVRYLRRSVR